MTEKIDILWILICSMLVFLMQFGFLSLECGLVRGKNTINVALKNITDLGISQLIFWTLGFSIAFGPSIFGSDKALTETFFFFEAENAWYFTFFVYQAMFCSTCATIISGAVAERSNFNSYCFTVVFVSSVIYPIIVNLVWNGAESGETAGFLAKLGFFDYAGSTVVHSTGGWVALAAIIALGPRHDRYSKKDKYGDYKKIPPFNIPQSTSGFIILWFGWLGFNGGSALAFNDQAYNAILTTLLSGSAGLVSAFFLSQLFNKGTPKVEDLINGGIGSLVGITASANFVGMFESIIIGFLSVPFVLFGSQLLEKLELDDVVSAIPVHLCAGIWGTLAVGIFGNSEKLGTGLSYWNQIMVQGFGVILCGSLAFFPSLLFFKILQKFIPIRVDLQSEIIGLNIAEHDSIDDISRGAIIEYDKKDYPNKNENAQ